MKRVATFLVCILLVGCSSKDDAGPYKTSLPMKDVMGHVISPGAYAFWGAWGQKSNETGTHDLRPTTEEGWLLAENGAATVAEGANLLMLPSRRVDEEDWMKYSKNLADAALAAMAAAEARDSDRMGETGLKLYEVCEACHEKYQKVPSGRAMPSAPARP